MTPTVKRLTGSRKRDFRLCVSNTISPRSGWDGGSRDYHELVAYCPGVTVPALVCGDCFSAPTVSQELVPGTVMVTTGVFCGKPGWPCITCREDEVDAVRSWLGI